MKCQNNLKQIGLAFHNYHDALGAFPNGGRQDYYGTNSREDRWCWMYKILPFVEQDNLYKSTDNLLIRRTSVPIYHCPSRRSPTIFTNFMLTDYAGAAGLTWEANATNVNQLYNGVVIPQGDLLRHPVYAVAGHHVRVDHRRHVQHRPGGREVRLVGQVRRQPVGRQQLVGQRLDVDQRPALSAPAGAGQSGRTRGGRAEPPVAGSERASTPTPACGTSSGRPTRAGSTSSCVTGR